MRIGLLTPLPLFLVLAFAVAMSGARRLTSSSSDPSRAVVDALRRERLFTTVNDVHWLDPPPGRFESLWKRPRAAVRARAGGARGSNWDIYWVCTRWSPDGGVLDQTGVFDLTRTSAVGEDELTAESGRAAWIIGGEGRVDRVELADFRGEPDARDAHFTKLARVERALTNLERTGQLAGVGRRSFKLDPAARQVTLALEPTRLVVTADAHRIVIPFESGRAIEGERFVREVDRTVASPGNLITWAVDRVRGFGWFGDERMQFTKAIAYALLDRVDRAVGSVRTEPVEAPSAPELGHESSSVPTDADTGWPPRALSPPLHPALAREGEWFLLDQDPYTRTSAAVPVPLVTTYLRADGKRPESRVYIVEWDPRQVDLDMVAGTEEPVSATGETGDGLIPRTPRTMTRVIAAFNGGFQSTHGDFGMMEDRSLLVPPKPYAATIARLEDGSTAFGTWPADTTIPKNIVSFRQNLTPLVGNGAFNPYGRTWWGGVPHDWEDVTHTVRTGLCMTTEGFVAYFYGTSIDPVRLGRVMLAARCDYGMHLDMNQGHTGLELYRVDVAENLPPLDGKLERHWQAEGDVPDMPGYRFRGRRLIKNMHLMHFPRYIQRAGRDYFYLMLRPLLPPERLSLVTNTGNDEGEGDWDVKRLPQGGFPYALAMTSLCPDPARPDTKVRILAVDPTTLRIAASDAPEETILTLDIDPHSAEGQGQASLWLDGPRALIATGSPSVTATVARSGTTNASPGAEAAIGVDDDGKLFFVEVATAPDRSKDGALLGKVLDALRCKAHLFLSSPVGVLLGGKRDLAGHPASPAARDLRLVRDTAQVRQLQRARRLFPETPILKPAEWMPLQRQTRSFPKEDAPAPSTPPTAPTPTTAPTPSIAPVESVESE